MRLDDTSAWRHATQRTAPRNASRKRLALNVGQGVRTVIAAAFIVANLASLQASAQFFPATPEPPDAPNLGFQAASVLGGIAPSVSSDKSASITVAVNGPSVASTEQVGVLGPNGYHHILTGTGGWSRTLTGLVPGAYSITEIQVNDMPVRADQSVSVASGQIAAVRLSLYGNRALPFSPAPTYGASGTRLPCVAHTSTLCPGVGEGVGSADPVTGRTIAVATAQGFYAAQVNQMQLLTYRSQAPHSVLAKVSVTLTSSGVQVTQALTPKVALIGAACTGAAFDEIDPGPLGGGLTSGAPRLPGRAPSGVLQERLSGCGLDTLSVGVAFSPSFQTATGVLGVLQAAWDGAQKALSASAHFPACKVLNAVFSQNAFIDAVSSPLPLPQGVCLEATFTWTSSRVPGGSTLLFHTGPEVNLATNGDAQQVNALVSTVSAAVVETWITAPAVLVPPSTHASGMASQRASSFSFDGRSFRFVSRASCTRAGPPNEDVALLDSQNHEIWSARTSTDPSSNGCVQPYFDSTLEGVTTLTHAVVFVVSSSAPCGTSCWIKGTVTANYFDGHRVRQLLRCDARDVLYRFPMLTLDTPELVTCKTCPWRWIRSTYRWNGRMFQLVSQTTFPRLSNVNPWSPNK